MLLLMPTTTYRADDFIAAAKRLGVEVVYGTDRCHVLADLGAVEATGDSLVLDFREPEASVQKIRAYAAQKPLQAVVAADDQTTLIAALAAGALGLPHNDPDGARAAKDKLRMRALLRHAGVRQARFARIGIDRDPARASEWIGRRVGFPCVLKPRTLSASRGVIRADDAMEFGRALARVIRILRDAEVSAKGGRAARSVLVESFVPGVEVALEALLVSGRLEVLAVFDKPNPLDGPFFEETIYVTPSRLPAHVQEDVRATAQSAARALGLSEGPLHAELRINDAGAHLVELAPRSIGGLCARTLRFGAGVSLEELIIRHAFGMDVKGELHARDGSASGVMMLPIPRTGTLRAIHGIEDARSVPLVEDVVITAKLGREIVALPEGNAYLGFVFARGRTPDQVESALRRAASHLVIEISPQIPVL